MYYITLIYKRRGTQLSKVATYEEVYLCVHKQGGPHVGNETGHKVSGS